MWLSDPNNRELLTMLGAAFAAIVMGSWAWYKWLYRSTAAASSARTSGDNSPIIKAGGNVSYLISTRTVKSFSVGDDRFLPSKYWEHFRWSFARPEYINPRLVEEFVGWLSDSGDVVVAMDLEHAQNSDRFYCDFRLEELDGQRWVHYDAEEEGHQPAFFRYRHIATSPSGVHILQCLQGTGGSGIFGSVLLLALQADTSLTEADADMVVRDRIILKTVGGIGLGDRYVGDISYREGILSVGADIGIMPYKSRERPFSVRIG